VRLKKNAEGPGTPMPSVRIFFLWGLTIADLEVMRCTDPCLWSIRIRNESVEPEAICIVPGGGNNRNPLIAGCRDGDEDNNH